MMNHMKTGEASRKTHAGGIKLVVEPKKHDLGGFSVRRVLPSSACRSVGPFVFFDEMGPAEFAPGQGIDVRPHPHIGLATLTYLFDGEIIHRDSLGSKQAIRPGAVNLMTAGSGIVHSERSADDRSAASSLHGIQTWLALPEEMEEMASAFQHYPAESLPQLDMDGASVRLVVGAAYGSQSPVKVHSPMTYLDIILPADKHVKLPEDCTEMALYVATGTVAAEGEHYRHGIMAVAAGNSRIIVRAVEDSRLVVIGGDPLGYRHLWWNFVSSSRERIEQAKEDWRSGRFGKVPGDPEFIPLPDD